MKKIINTVKKYDNIFMLLWIIIMATTITFNILIDANDELWNFSNIYKMHNGYTIYQDINVIITPLFFVIGKILFFLFGANYFTFRIYETTIVYTFLFFIIYQVLKKMKVAKLNAIIYTTLIAITCINVMVDASYNMLAISFVILGIYNLVSTTQTRKTTAIIQAIIIFLIFLSKQNIAVYYTLALIFYQLIIEDKKYAQKIKTIIIEIAILGVLFLLFYICMKINGIWESFVNYAFLGIGEFSEKNIRGSILSILIGLIESVITITILIVTYNKKIPFNTEQKNNIRILGIFSLAMLLIIYPIYNVAHILIASVNFSLFFFYLINSMFFQEIIEQPELKNIIKKSFFVLIVTVIFCNMYKNIPYFIEINKKDYYFHNKPYYGAIATREKLEELEEIVNYIQKENEKGIEVKIISYHSNLYMNILNKNNGDMDLPFYGNMGKSGEDGMIEKIKTLEKTKILILTKEDDKYQESKKITNYIKENLEYKGKIRQFSIYENK